MRLPKQSFDKNRFHNSFYVFFILSFFFFFSFFFLYIAILLYTTLCGELALAYKQNLIHDISVNCLTKPVSRTRVLL